jgi:hypothetical protein
VHSLRPLIDQMSFRTRVLVTIFVAVITVLLIIGL